MPLREDILKPIPGDNPSGRSLRSDPVYDKIKEARRQDDELPQGVWQHERKLADLPLVIKLAQDTIATQSKDLQLAAWLSEALLKKEGMRGFTQGLNLCRGLLTDFWDTVYPMVDEGDLEDRASPVEWLSSRLMPAVKGQALCEGGYDFFQYKQSRLIPTEEGAKSKEDKAEREKQLKEGKLAPELFDRSFAETPKVFYSGFEKTIDEALAAIEELDKVCQEKLEDFAPSFGSLKEGIRELRQVVHSLLQKKRETDPDPVEEKPPEPEEGMAEGGEAAAEGTEEVAFAGGGSETLLSFRTAAEPAGRREAIASVAAAAAYLRKQEPFSPAPYLMLRGMRWGELRGTNDPSVLEAPPSDLRQQVKSLAMRNKWAELLTLSENIMALPCSRAWLDLQRFVVEACVALGDEYGHIAVAIRSELRSLLRDVPHLMEAMLSDDTPAANPQTQAWLKEILAEPAGTAPQPTPPRLPVMDSINGTNPGWQKKYVDAQALAQEAMRTGQAPKAVGILQKEVERQLSGRGRFLRKLQLAQVCIQAGKDAIAQPLLDDITAAIDAHKLEDWEDREMVAGALMFLAQNSKKIQADAKLKQAIFERICRLDPVQALSI